MKCITVIYPLFKKPKGKNSFFSFETEYVFDFQSALSWDKCTAEN